MKRTILVFTLLMAAFVSAFAQGERTNVVKINLFSPIVSTVSVFYEKALSDQNSFQINFFYTGASIEDTQFRGFGLTPEYRFYLSENKVAPAGFYLGPFLRYQNFNLSANDGSQDDAEATLSTFGGGVLVGGQWLFKDKIALDLFIGPSYNAGDLKVTDGSEDEFSTGILSGFGVRLGASIGYAF